MEAPNIESRDRFLEITWNLQSAIISGEMNEAIDTQRALNNHGRKDVFHFVWLRDNCPCGKCVHATSFQKLRSSATIPLQVRPAGFSFKESSLLVNWDDGHESEYSFAWLRAHAYHDASHEERTQKLKPMLWKAEDISEKQSVDFKSFMSDDKVLADSLRIFIDYGILFVKNVPKETSSVENVATRIGPIRETFFGRTWDVVNVPKSTNIAYTSVDLGLHQDLPYFDSVPPVQMLHCMTQSKNGGESVFVDSYMAAERLMRKYPVHFETLLRVPMKFQYTNSGHNFHCHKPILFRNENQYIGVNFSPQNHGPLNVAPKEIEPFYAAFKQFSDEIYSPDMVLTKKLAEGELVMFDNMRVLHGRAMFDPTEPRHLRGTYIGMDEVRDALAKIEARKD